ncbi:MAG TPA: hypothetical protein VF605_10710 [Allosphingosinicella sp.]|jgi:hypothetical protein
MAKDRETGAGKHAAKRARPGEAQAAEDRVGPAPPEPEAKRLSACRRFD